ELSAVCADHANVRNKDVADGDARAATAAHADRVPVIEYLDIAFGQQREHEIAAGLLLRLKSQQVPLGVIDPGVERPYAFFDLKAPADPSHLAAARLEHRRNPSPRLYENLLADLGREQGWR